MDAAWQEMVQTMSTHLPKLLGALAILILGWLLALLVSALVRGILRRTSLDNRLAGWLVGDEKVKALDLEGMTGKAVFYLLMMLVLVAFFQTLGLTLVTEPLNRALNEVSRFLPRLAGAAGLLIIAWMLARAVRLILTRGLGAAKVDERLGDELGREGAEKPSLTKTLADTVFWLILLLFLPAVLSTLALEGLLAPIEGMLAELLTYLPNLLAAGLILMAGWLIARILQRIVTNLLIATGADRLSDKVGLGAALGTQKLSGMLGMVVYVLVLIPVVVAALDALQLQALSRPASDMLNQILSVLPSVFAAIVVVMLAFGVGKLVAGLVTNLLSGAGFDVVLVKLGLGEEPVRGERTPSSVVGFLVLLAFMLLASMEAFRLLGFTLLADIIAQFNVFAGKVLIGLVIFALGLFLANLVHRRIMESGTTNAGFLASLARISVLVLAAAMGVQQIGIGSDVVRLVLAVILGAVALAFAISFGIGSREAAGRLVEEWIQSMRSNRSSS